MKYESFLVERIENGFLVIFSIADDDGEWSPEKEKPKERVMGIEINRTKTFYAKDRRAVISTIEGEYFEAT